MPARLRVSRSFGRWSRAILLASVVGVLAGLAAALLEAALHEGTLRLIGRFAELGGPEILRFRTELLWLPALGGLTSGVVVQLLARQPGGHHGTDQLVRAFHQGDGVMALPGPAVRATAAVGVISCGGSAGPEGPIAALGAALGSRLGGALRLSARERRVLLLSGCAAGVGAIFHCPLGGALFATSILYRRPEFEGSALVSAFIASAVGYATFMSFHGFGTHLLTDADQLVFASPVEIPVYVVLGLLCGATAILFAATFRAIESAFRRMERTPIWIRPALGGLLTGALACALPQVMDGEYRMIQNALDGSLFAGADGAGRSWLAWAALLGLIVVAKCVATGFTVGSGAAGGVLGPSLFLGGAVGAFLGALLQGGIPGALPEGVRMALVPVGMAGVLAAFMRTPIAAIVMVVEMTGSFGLIVPLMVATMTAYLVGGRHGGLMDAQLMSSADSPAHAGDLLVGLLERVRVGEVMQGVWPAVAERRTPLARVLASLAPGEPPTAVVLDRGRPVGVISFAELRHLLEDEEALAPVAIAADVMTTRFEVLDPEDTLYDALAVFEGARLDAVPVVDGASGAFRGVLTRGAVHAVVVDRLTRVREDLLHEHAGLAAIEEQAQLVHLLSGLPSPEAGRMLRIGVEPELVGRSLREVDFRRTRGAVVLGIQTGDHRFICPPDPARPLRADDQQLVLTAADPTAGAEDAAVPAQRAATSTTGGS
jgi:chloride channel protein, CIC family